MFHARLSVLLDVALEVDLNALRHEALAAGATAATKDVATIFGLHAGAETELLFPGALGGLIGSFWHKRVWGSRVTVTGSLGGSMLKSTAIRETGARRLPGDPALSNA